MWVGLYWKTIHFSSFEFLKLQSPYLELLTNFQNINPSVKVIFPHIYLTSKDGKFLNHFKLSSNDESLPLYYDDDHLNSFGSKAIVKEILSKKIIDYSFKGLK